MRRHGYYILILLLLLGSMIARAQNRNNLISAKGKLILLIDLNSPKKELDSIFKNAGIAGVNVKAVIKGDYSAITKDGWALVKQQNNIVQFNMPIKDMGANPQNSPYLITTNFIKTDARPGYPENIMYGVNRFSMVSVYELPSGLTRFILPGYLSAKRVFLSGSFNDWSTLKGLMVKTATGWSIDLKLQPGAYEYKFIANGRWMTDPNNLIVMDDGAGNSNSFYFKYNYTFKLKGFASARRVSVAGSFNNGNANELILQRKGDAWELPIYLHDGMHAYRFLVDGKWITDPANPDKYTDDNGDISSVINIGGTVNFDLNGYGGAKDVYVAGSFNNWKPGKIKLKRSGDNWRVKLILPAGNYQYQFIVDGQWILDPSNQNRAVEGGKTNSFLAVKPNHLFKLKGYDGAKVIHLSGTFNDWAEDSYTLAHTGDEWSIALYLKPGKYLYKFIVDGNWMLDPGNKLWEQNQYNTGNSVLWME